MTRQTGALTMTSWQIFALSSPAIVVFVMWLQGLAEGYFNRASASDRQTISGSSGFVRGARAKAKQD
jgi:hypothetical protein